MRKNIHFYLPRDLYNRALRKAAKLGYKSFTHLITDLLTKWLKERTSNGNQE